ncbi:carbonate dehydratase [Marinomonas mediterranea]|jgi:Carbonic anhydrase|uniref:Carbonic anhydrase n=1 Tax=Marinomonas mediterranea (strain ATCC 700492 / JCM 21426 / NBRC 103028 / MMB-1) TaxID=717774 RepID=F2JVT8_MARM1|nr:carbonate dehydratase [Marinomonas mediterranea]ADZ91724.1 Carbonate dehydratase [Marinomonas mediterranea MMB-1]WCN09684.1 carbonate dehydratase [Marinomonas mediterranea]WCN13765.1 carbonate dehydratase [Marinomonas mediterranea]WCN17820.1 carbonate dehydratase [Marinomonas mediterranea MMB-1]
MSSKLPELFEKNRQWAAKVNAEDPDFFEKLSKQQKPEYLWIGCADSRVPANQIVDLMPGEVFVHRNIANVVVHTDLNCLSVIQFAVDVLKVKHIMVVGHYGCGGIKAAMDQAEHGLIDNWLRHIKDVYRLHKEEVDAIEDDHERFDRMCELNVIEQVANVRQTSVVQSAWKNGQELHVHGWCYSISNGHIKDLNVTSSNNEG